MLRHVRAGGQGVRRTVAASTQTDPLPAPQPELITIRVPAPVRHLVEVVTGTTGLRVVGPGITICIADAEISSSRTTSAASDPATDSDPDNLCG